MRPVFTGTSVTLPPWSRSMTRTTSSPEPFCFTAAIGTVSTLAFSWIDDLDRHERAVGRAEIADLDLAFVHLLLARRRRAVERREVLVELGDRPGSVSVPPTSSTVQLLADLQLGAVRRRRLQRHGEVRIGERAASACPAARIAFLHEHLADANRPRPDDHVGREEHHVLVDRSTAMPQPSVPRGARGADERLEVLAGLRGADAPGS